MKELVTDRKNRPVLNLVFLPPAAPGHNSQGHPDWFKYGPGETAPGVITRPLGEIPNVVPAGSHRVGMWHECTEEELAAIRKHESSPAFMRWLEKIREDEAKAYFHGRFRQSNERPKIPALQLSLLV